MSLLDALRLAVRHIRGRLLESLMTMLGVALGVGVIASTLSLAQTVGRTEQPDRELQVIHVRVAGSDPPRARNLPVQRVNPGVPREAHLDITDIEGAKAVAPDVAYGYFQAFLNEPRTGETQAKPAVPTVLVIAGDFFAAHGSVAAAGTLFSAADEAQGARVAVLGAQRAALLFPEGDAVGSTVTFAGLDHTVVGTLAPALQTGPQQPSGPDDLLYIPLRSSPAFEKLRYMPDLSFMASRPETVRQAAGQLDRYFESRLGSGAVVVIAGRSETDEEIAQIRAVITVLLGFAGSALLIASINILNVLLARVARRVRSSGISVALGSSRGGVFRMYLLESATLGLAGCAVGVAFAVLFTALIGALFSNGSPDDRMFNTFQTIAPAIAAALALNLLFAAYPAWRASRMNAADAIRAD